jgi:hypothetical protein
MTDFKLNRHFEINEHYQGANITEFHYSNPKDVSNDYILNDFLKSGHIEKDCIRDYVKNSPNRDGFLKGAFILSEINSDDFKKYSRNEVVKFLNDILLEPDWHEDLEDFKRIHDRFIHFLNDLNADIYFTISKEWFDDLSSKKLTPESWVYVYYFLIIWIDNNSKTLGFSEFDSD